MGHFNVLDADPSAALALANGCAMRCSTFSWAGRCSALVLAGWWHAASAAESNTTLPLHIGHNASRL